jgi:hypothetical protein
MLLHVQPKLFSPFRNVALINLDILGLHLTQKELATRRPYANKRWAVACRRQGGTKAIEGILIETKAAVSEYRYIARWAIEAQHVVAHEVHCKIVDHDFDATSEDVMLWQACCKELGGWAARSCDFPRPRQEPAMEIFQSEVTPFNADDTVDQCGMIVLRKQTWEMPTIERERIINSKLDHDRRIPSLAMAFHIG